MRQAEPSTAFTPSGLPAQAISGEVLLEKYAEGDERSLIIHRYAMLGALNEEGFPLRDMGVLESSSKNVAERGPVMAGKVCLECGNATVIHKDDCDFCTACGDIGQCG